MKFFKKSVYLIGPWVASWAFYGGGCTTTQITPPKPPVPPSYTQVPHPVGLDMGDLAGLFLDNSSPKDPDYHKTCDADFLKLKNVTRNGPELGQGTVELVRREPVFYHWCFYAKLLHLEEFIKAEAFVDEKQKAILNTYEFLVPVARGFAETYHDSRYLRWAVTRYQHMSEWIFYRKVELTPAGTVDLVQPSNPFGLYRDSGGKHPILEKYHFVETLREDSPFAQPSSSPVPGPSSRGNPEAEPPAPPTVETFPVLEPSAAAILPQPAASEVPGQPILQPKTEIPLPLPKPETNLMPTSELPPEVK